MRYFATFYLSLFLCFTVFAQQDRLTHQLNFGDEPIEIQLPQWEGPFTAVSFKWSGEEKLEVALLEADASSVKWQDVWPDHHVGDGVSNGQMIYVEPSVNRLLVRANAAQPIQVHLYNPGHTKPGDISPVQSAAQKSCPCPPPAWVTRSNWCPANNCTPTSPAITDVTHYVVHHSAGSNSSSDWPAVVRAIWNFHVNDRGWDDVGYNYLIDPNGQIYVGRGDDIRGAHFSGTNSNTSGVCVLGNYQVVYPKEASLKSLVELLAWDSCDEGIDPMGRSLHAASNLVLDHICGHRDGVSPTSCPGNLLYPKLPEIRERVRDRIISGCSGVPGATQLAATPQIDPPSVYLTWVDHAADEDVFELERSEDDSNNFTLLTTLPADTTFYVDSNVVLNTRYYYRIRSVRSSEYSDYSNMVSATPMTVAVHDPLLLPGLKIQPNPTTGETVVLWERSHEEPLLMKIFDMQGRLVNQQPVPVGQHLITLDMSKYEVGMYLISLEDQIGRRALQRLAVLR